MDRSACQKTQGSSTNGNEKLSPQDKEKAAEAENPVAIPNPTEF